ncbi:MAG: hypothetical protein K0R66_1686 [Gammaproteobacteria bacterium]|jgi:hypothetical protein|nr:hypothetical protein [Gammaproteobacteria bacterium]
MYKGHDADSVIYQVIDDRDAEFNGSQVASHPAVTFLTEQQYYAQDAEYKAYQANLAQQELDEKYKIFQSCIEGKEGHIVQDEDGQSCSFILKDQSEPIIRLHSGSDGRSPCVEIEPAATHDLPGSEDGSLGNRSSPVEDVTASGRSTSRTTDSLGSRDRSGAFCHASVNTQAPVADQTSTVFYNIELNDGYFAKGQAASVAESKMQAFDRIESPDTASAVLANLETKLGF